MKTVLESLVEDSLERDWPRPVPREVGVLRRPGKVSVLVGMRRTGKTYLCFQRMRALLDQGIPAHRLLYLNFEDDRLATLTVADLRWIPEHFYALHPDNKNETCHFFFDEIQRVEGWELFVRRLCDTENVELTVTGSSAKLLSLEIGTSLRGRGLTTEVFPLNFREYCLFNQLELPDKTVGSRQRAILQNAAAAYLAQGGFPEVQGVDAFVRRAILQEYVGAVILRDVVERHGVSNVGALRALVRQILQNPGGALGITKFAGSLTSQGIPVSKNTLHDLLDHVRDAYLCFAVEIHDRSVRRRQLNDRKIYPVDVGLQHAYAAEEGGNRGHTLESAVFIHLRMRGLLPDYFRTDKGHEVDFITVDGDETALYQCCWTLSDPTTRAREFRALSEAGAVLPKARRTIITFDEEGEQDGIQILPFWRWALRSSAQRPSAPRGL